MITKKEALEIHTILVEQFGGANGLRDVELLESAINRPFQTFDGNELYPTVIEKAAPIIESIVKGTSINSFWNAKAGIFPRYKAPKTEFSIAK